MFEAEGRDASARGRHRPTRIRLVEAVARRQHFCSEMRLEPHAERVSATIQEELKETDVEYSNS